jgi:hypothetical protein
MFDGKLVSSRLRVGGSWPILVRSDRSVGFGSRSNFAVMETTTYNSSLENSS